MALSNDADPRDKRTQFPIFEVKSDYWRKGRGGISLRDSMLEGVRSDDAKVIDGLQPWQRGKDAHEDPLAILRSITDRHKHRELHTGIAFLTTFEALIIWDEVPWYDDSGRLSDGPIGRAELRIKLGELDKSQRLKDGEILWDVAQIPAEKDSQSEFIKRGLPNRVAVPAPAVFTIAFSGDRVATIRELDRVVEHATSIIERFNR